MSRVKRSVPSRARRNKILGKAKGFYGRRKNTIRTASQSVDRSGQHSYIGRKLRKRNFRALWIQRINAGAREHGLTYSQFMHGIKLARLDLDRKVLSDLAIREPEAFEAIAATARSALNAPPAAAAA